MGSALMRGRTLNKRAVALAKDWRVRRIRVLLSIDRLGLSNKERAEARRLTSRWDFWNYSEEDKYEAAL